MPYNRVHPAREELNDYLARIQEKYHFPMSAVEYTTLVRRELPSGQKVSAATVRKYLGDIGSRYRPLEEGERTSETVGYLRQPRDMQVLNDLFAEPVREHVVVATSDDDDQKIEHAIRLLTEVLENHRDV